MRKVLWIIPAVLFVVMGVTDAHADIYSVSFTCDSTTVPCVGPYGPSSTDVILDPATPNSNDAFTVTWDTLPFTFAAGTLGLPSDSYTWAASYTGGPEGAFSIFDNGGPAIPGQDILLNPIEGSAGGTLTFTNVPEPASASLMMIGIGFLGFVIRKRVALGLQQAS